MAQTSFRDRLGQRLDLVRWARATAAARNTGHAELARREVAARALRRQLDAFLAIAADRLTRPRIGGTAIPRPAGTDWVWRPQFWREPLAERGVVSPANKTMLGSEVTLFHDCAAPEISIRQVRNSTEDDLAPFGLRLEVYRFDGSFLSLVLECPQAGSEGLRKRHLIRLEATIDLERPLEVFARLNVRHGPNTEQIVRELDIRDGKAMVEFDLAYTKLNEKRVENMWVDLIFEGPQMNQVTMRDVTLCRLPRAEF